MAPGDYEVHVGVYRRSTGQRLRVLEGGLPDQRIHLGTFHVKRLLPFVHQLIPPTRVDKMRKYPDRIISSGR
jgi:hypothetical protein